MEEIQNVSLLIKELKETSFDKQYLKEQLETFNKWQNRVEGNFEQAQEKVLEDSVSKTDECTSQVELDDMEVEQNITANESGAECSNMVQGVVPEDNAQGKIPPFDGTSSGNEYCRQAVVPESSPQAEIPQFDGTTSWNEYRQQFQAVVRVNGWNSEQCLTALTVALRGEALAILEALPSGYCVETLLEALEGRYGNKHPENAFCEKMDNRDAESQQRAQPVTIQCPETCPHVDSIRRDLIVVKGIRNSDARSLLQQQRSQTSLKEALAHSFDMKAVRPNLSNEFKAEIVIKRRPPELMVEKGPHKGIRVDDVTFRIRKSSGRLDKMRTLWRNVRVKRCSGRARLRRGQCYVHLGCERDSICQSRWKGLI